MIRAGLGFDAHPFAADRALVIGGVMFPDAPGLSGHSDADVLCHAVADAVLGAAGLGDLGQRFPADERWADSSSLEILVASAEEVGAEGWTIQSVDATVIAERPRLSPHRAAMERNIAEALTIAPEQVSVKSTTTDGMGFTGRAEGIAALAVVLVERARVGR
ncbi:MAG: 2-C-methyl-D-erythritol 2,4-cyclodiphosphate synthase [Actinomycetota bacterium]